MPTKEKEMHKKESFHENGKSDVPSSYAGTKKPMSDT